ncbi:MAG: protein kinase [Phycisphaerales bacterium]
MSNQPAANQFDRLAELFRTAVSLDDAGRVSLLDRARSEDPTLADELSELLSFDDPSVATRLEPLPGVGAAIRRVADDAPTDGSSAPTAAPMTPPASGSSDGSNVIAAAGLATGQRIADFEIVGPIAAGGMGMVYEARQDHPARRVAIKVMRADLGSPRTQARFRFEADVLARLDHPGIAAIHAAGTIDAPGEESGTPGAPWMAMEFIEGAAPITRAANARGLDVHARVGLLLDAARAMRHAHQRGVIHRDLKPGNVLVGEDGRARIIDFGVARDVDRMSQATRHTEAGDLLGTLAYMSPEQCRGNPDDIDVRSDVYAMGVLLHELITGRKPINLDGLPLAEAVRQVSERGVPAISETLVGVDADLQTVARMATALDPRDRYQSMDAFVVDLERWVRGDAVSARPPGPIRRIQLFVRQHPAATALIGLSAVFATVVVLMIGAYGVQITRESEARQQALERSDSMLAFLKGILVTGEFDDDATTGHTLLDVVQSASARVESEFGDDPAAAASLWAAIGSSFRSLGDLDAAESAFEHQRARAIEAHGTISSPHVEALTNLAAILADRFRVDRSKALYHEALAIAEQDASILKRTGLSIEYSLLALEFGDGRYTEVIEPLGDLANRIARRVADASEASGRTDIAAYPQLLISARRLQALAITNLGRVDEGIEKLEALAAEVELNPGPANIVVLNDLGWAQMNDSRFDASLETFQNAEALSRTYLGESAPRTHRIRTNIIDLFVRAGRYDDAIETSTLLLTDMLKNDSIEESFVADVEQTLWRAHLDKGNIPEALAAAESAHARLTRRFGPDHLRTARTAQMIGLALGRTPGREAEGLTYLSASRDTIRDVDGPNSSRAADAENDLGIGHFRLAGYAAAAMHFEQALRINSMNRSRDDVECLKNLGNLGRAWFEAGDFESAIGPLDEAAELVQSVLPADHPIRTTIMATWGETLAALGRCVEAIPPLEIGLAAQRAARGDDDPRVLRMQATIEACRASVAPASTERASPESASPEDATLPAAPPATTAPAGG